MTPNDVLGRIEPTLSRARRLSHVALTLAASAATTVIALLWATEPALPARAAWSFAILIIIGLSWVAFGLWVLTRRTPLYARDRVIAARLALGAWLTVTAGCAILRAFTPPSAVLLSLLGLAAVTNLLTATRARKALQHRRAALHDHTPHNHTPTTKPPHA
jgi:hypothetical protein